MVTGTHPEDVELFDYVEGDLPAERRAGLEVHLATCAQCSEEVARMQAGREALRESQFLHLPPRRRDAIFLNLPAQRRAPGRSPALSPKRLLAILTPVAAVAAVVAALVTTGALEGGGGGGGAGQAGATFGAAEAETSRQASGGGKAFDQLLKVAGPADKVAALLREKGFDARAVGNNRVEVRNATKAQVERALSSRRTGKVRIVIVQ
jgi:anti-sigma factor RsiW